MRDPSNYSTLSLSSPLTPPGTPDDYPRSSRCLSAKNKDFYRWRPSYHLMAPGGWMNDPCGLGFDRETGLYHVSFQWNPHDNNWGNISWAHATSPDLVSWTIDEKPCLSPDTLYDRRGVFTGCLLNADDGWLVYVYTSVSALPIHYTLDYRRGCESLSLAASRDNGNTWFKYPSNPVLPGPPEGVEVTGFRDPFVAPWPAMSRLLGRDERRSMYGTISGGIRDQTPTLFLYSIDTRSIHKWDYLGQLVDLGQNFRPSKWSGDLGKNWEVTNFLTLYDDNAASVSRNFLVMGVEGVQAANSLNKEEEKEGKQHEAKDTLKAPKRTLRNQLWMCGNLQKKHDDPTSSTTKINMTYNYGGYLDHGCLYAANSFHDPVSSAQIYY
ncbi:hypothetical protein LTS18_011923, partial [Coniosporium uncinatum]